MSGTLSNRLLDVRLPIASVALTEHSDKAFIGRIDKGFDFLGYHFSRAGLSIAIKTVERFVKHATQLYEHEQHGSTGTPLFGRYVRRWESWALGGLGEKHKPRIEAELHMLGNLDGLLCLTSAEPDKPYQGCSE